MDKLIEDEYISRIIDSLKESRKTIKQLAVSTGIPERHVREAFDTLKKQKYVLSSGYYNRSVVWRINSAVLGFTEGSGRLPYHDLKVTGGSANLVDIALSGMVKSSILPDPTAVTRAEYYSRCIYPLLAELLGEVVSDEPHQETIDEVHSQLLQAYKVMMSTTSLLKQILSTKEYWTADKLAQLREAPLVKNSEESIKDTASLARIYRLGDSSGTTP